MPFKLNIFAWYDHLSSRERRIFQFAAGFILLLLVDQVVFTRVWDSYSLIEEQIAEAEGTYVRNLVNLKRQETVESDYAKYRSFIRPAGKDEEENASLLSEVEQLARSNQVVLVDMKPREVKAHQFHKEYSAELDAEAEMEALIKFIYELEQSPQLMRISNAKLNLKEAESTFVRVKLTVTKTVFLK